MTSVMRAAVVAVIAIVCAGVCTGLAGAPAWAQSAPPQTASPTGAKVYFINLKDGQDVTSPFLVQFGLAGMGVAPAGVEKPNTGHHHLLIDATLSDEQLKQPIAMDDTHRHFGGGQTEALITLAPGQHKLQLVLGDWAHIPHAPPVMSDVITVTVR